MEEAPTTATRATLRDLLQAQVAALELTPKWLWEIEFALHVWPILERFHREKDPLAIGLVGLLRNTNTVAQGIHVIRLDLSDKPEEIAPW